MTSFGRLTASLLNLSQENTIALANLNFNLSLFKCDAPLEYHALGESLSKSRRTAAEDGHLNDVARKLGALFESEIPDVPDLIRAYGHRASEIATNTDVNPKGTAKDGAFADYVGADGTTIWATATSGGNVVTMHLLACMIANLWKRDEAVALWRELIKQRTKLLRERAGAGLYEAMLSRITIESNQLADWDASARYV